uniref:DUS-like FMN-binding domain-containing protein n=1 Tax=Clastoptera arizonana TaxID=38151 RepID=A0A1B6CGX9_9HEMI
MKLVYSNKTILAPMVRIGTLPMRLLCLDYGADIVYCEELIDWKLLRSERKINDVLGTVDFVDKTDGTIVFRTCEREKDRVVLQMGTCDPERALKAAKLVENDVAAVDINMGCPKEFSIKGGMGVALLSDPSKAQSILRTLVNGLQCPVTCKIRVFPDCSETINLCKGLEDCGIKAIGVHGRTKQERPQHSNRNDMIKAIANALTIPVIANGGSKEIECFEDIDKFRRATGCSSVMIARSAEWNCSIFRKQGKLPLDEVIISYLHYAIDYDNSPSNTKYCVQNMLRELQDTPRGRLFLETQTLEQICDIWKIGDYCRQKQNEYRTKGLKGRVDVIPMEAKRLKIDTDVNHLHCAFLRSLYPKDTDLPKTKLLIWTRIQGWKQPSYKTIQLDKLFQSMVIVNGIKYGSTYWEKNKRWAEQGAAIVCLCLNNVIDINTLRKNGSIAG